MEVHGVSCNADDPGVTLLHHFEQINILDQAGVADYIRQHQIEYVYSVGSDIAMPTVAYAARQTGLASFISPETAAMCCNKHQMRRALADTPWQLEHIICRQPQDVRNAAFYPTMMKPVDSQGQRGVFLCRNAEEALARFARSMQHSRCGEVILERYIPGDEVSFNGYLQDGKWLFGLMSDRESFAEYPGGIVKGHRIPSKYAGTPVETAVRSLVEDVAKRLGIQNGPVYFQIMIHQHQPYLLEVTPRLDGCHMWQLIRLYCGVDLLGMTLQHLLDGHVDAPVWQPLVRAARTDFICQAPGTAFVPQESPASAIRRDYYRASERVRPINGHMEKCGYRMSVLPFRVALVGCSSRIGRCFARMFGKDFDLADISRTSGAVTHYGREVLAPLLRGCDAAVLLAAQTYIGEGADYTVNVRIAEETLRACAEAGVKQVIYLSSRCVYAKEAPSPRREDAAICPINAYGQSKYEAEQLFQTLADAHGIRVCVLRLAQVLDAENERTALHTFMTQALRGEPLTVYGTGQGQRDYIHISDVCRALRLALLRKAEGVFNIGSGRGVSVRELAQTVADAAGTGAQVVLHPDLPEDAAAAWLDIRKAQRELGFTPQLDLAAAVKRCLQYLREEAASR